MIGFYRKIKRRSQHLRAINNRRKKLWLDIIKIENREPRTIQELNKNCNDFQSATDRYVRHMARYTGYYGLVYVLFGAVWTTDAGVS